MELRIVIEKDVIRNRMCMWSLANPVIKRKRRMQRGGSL
jgi:hypothetical protein